MTPVWYHRPLEAGDEGDDVKIVQRKLGCLMTGVMDDRTQHRVRGLQRQHGWREDGIVSEKEAEALGEKESKGQVPGWFTRTLAVGDEGRDVEAVRVALKAPLKPVFYDAHLETVVRRFQAAVGLRPTGRVNQKTAVAIGDRTA